MVVAEVVTESSSGGSPRLDPFSAVLEAYRAGRPVIIMDRHDRENEGDIAIATEQLTPELVAFMIREARGLICVSVTREVASHLQLPFQVLNNSSPYQTPFAVSVDLRGAPGSSALADAVTAEGRCRTMRALIDPERSAADFVSPGHCFPLIANPAGVLGRQGQTEGALDLARIAGLTPSGVICEILNPDGTMARGAQIDHFAKTHELLVTSVDAIIRHRLVQEVFVEQLGHAPIATEWGTFNATVFLDQSDGKEHLALVFGDLQSVTSPLVRIHSECLTGDVLGSLRCDCGPQLSASMREIVRAGAGVVLYLRQEGRGIGLTNKIRAYSLQDAGSDTVDANLQLGLPVDARDFTVAAKILEALGVRSVRLITNNPHKVAGLEALGVTVAERLPLLVPATSHSAGYLATKRQRLGHLL